MCELEMVCNGMSPLVTIYGKQYGSPADTLGKTYGLSPQGPHQLSQMNADFMTLLPTLGLIHLGQSCQTQRGVRWR